MEALQAAARVDEAGIANTSKLQNEISKLKKDKEELLMICLAAEEEAAACRTELKSVTAQVEADVASNSELQKIMNLKVLKTEELEATVDCNSAKVEELEADVTSKGAKKVELEAMLSSNRQQQQ